MSTMNAVLPVARPEHPWVAHYEPGVTADVDIPAITVDGVLRRTARQTPDHTALNFLGARTSYAELDQAVDRFAHVLRGMGVEKGDRVSIHLPTTPAFVIALMGAMRAGAAAVPMNPLYVERELAILFADTTPKVSVTMDVLVPRMRKVAADGGGRPGRGSAGRRAGRRGYGYWRTGVSSMACPLPDSATKWVAAVVSR